MHKKIILLTRVDFREKVKQKVDSYLRYWGKQFSHWIIGGQFSGELGSKDSDIVLLSECLDIVKEEVQDPIKEYEMLISQAEKWQIKEEDGGNLIDDITKSLELGKLVSHYIYDLAYHFQKQDLSVYCNIYNLDTCDYSIPTNLENWYAIIIDLNL